MFTEAELNANRRLVRQWLAQSSRIVAFTGAGISTESGIPDFRGPQGVWTKDPEAEKLSNIHYYMNDPEVRKRAWQTRLNSPVWQAQPGSGHQALVELQQQGRLLAVITQNIDGLHQVAGNTTERVIELHGTMRDVVCMVCGDRNPAELTLQRLRAGEADPACLQCGGILKSATISFGQNLVQEDLRRAEQVAQQCDLLLALGSTLSVFPAAGVVPIAKRSGAKVVIINAGPTEMDDLADACLRGTIGEILPRLVAG